ncbi:DUF423 domain-containing protein [Flavobacterium agricola]|uniref:DUF423 domain-containing protein n=1 Tax=Flavobacterium agricola TaxID=2870839 RepID=A0ABY6M1J5_9FLAO|nr:DUF423 domain-containing protein [Flavobacterium agricola]UYW01524.1 DUF423 domain-containing protein [Flavobacterium agricola]
MEVITLNFGIIFGALAICFGAFGAHLLKKFMTPELLVSFETGVRYQMYHALALVLLSQLLDYSNTYSNYASALLIIGVFLFSFSIYGLCLSATFGKKIKILGPITPLGGLCLLLGWLLLLLASFN